MHAHMRTTASFAAAQWSLFTLFGRSTFEGNFAFNASAVASGTSASPKLLLKTGYAYFNVHSLKK